MSNMLKFIEKAFEIFIEKAFEKSECVLERICGMLKELKSNKLELPYDDLNVLIEKLRKKKEPLWKDPIKTLQRL